jgi:uncharacterized protein
MNPVEIIRKYYQEGSPLYEMLLAHDQAVANKALEIARMHPEMKLDTDFIYEAAMVHDIGIFETDAPEIFCFGPHPYICHGYLGSELMRQEGYPRHAFVCERHTGTGIPKEEIIKKGLPIPHREMMPVSLEEQLICFADKFYSKKHLNREKPIDKILKGLSNHGQDSADRFRYWCNLFLG